LTQRHKHRQAFLFEYPAPPTLVYISFIFFLKIFFVFFVRLKPFFEKKKEKENYSSSALQESN